MTNPTPDLVPGDDIDNALLVLKGSIAIKSIEYRLRFRNEAEIKEALVIKFHFLGQEFGNCLNPFDLRNPKPLQHKWWQELSDSFEGGRTYYKQPSKSIAVSH